jgi:hypothetical protein
MAAVGIHPGTLAVMRTGPGSELAILALIGYDRVVRPGYGARGATNQQGSRMRPPMRAGAIVGSVNGRPSPRPRPARRRSGPPPAADTAATTSGRHGRPVTIPPGATAGATPPGGPVALWPMLPCRSVLQPGGRQAGPGHLRGRPARVGATGPAHEPVVRGPILSEHGSQKAGGQRRAPNVLGLDLELVLLVGDREPAPKAVLPPPTPVVGVVARTARRSAAEIRMSSAHECTSAIVQGSSQHPMSCQQSLARGPAGGSRRPVDVGSLWGRSGHRSVRDRAW